MENLKKQKRRRLLTDLKMNKMIEELVDEVAERGQTLGELLEESDTLDVLNRVQMNKFLNVYLGNILQNVTTTQKLTNQLTNKILKKKEIGAPSDYVKLYLKVRELENEHLKLVERFCNSQQIKLDVSEQSILIIYRSLPPNLQKIMYNTIMEFVRQCPAIQREIAKTQGQEQQIEFENLVSPELRQEIMNQ